jgi:DNA-binding MarR family transcriptional regulator
MTTKRASGGRGAAGEASAALEPRLETGLGFTLGRIHRRLRAAWEARIADLGLTSPAASVVRAVAEHPGIGVRELARRLATDPMNAKRLVDGLERDGLLRSEADPDDQRRRQLRVTASGGAAHLELQRRAVTWRQDLGGILAPDESERLWRTLARLEDGLTRLEAPEPHDDRAARRD